MGDGVLMFAYRVMFWLSVYYQIDRGIQNVKGTSSKKDDFRKGDKAMFDKKEMKKIKLNKVGEYMMNGEPVYMVMMDGSLVEIEGASDLESIFFHTLTGGSFAVRRKKFEGIGNFAKSIKLGSWTFSINHEKKGGDEDVLTTGEEC